jgi:hypothetical protein
MRWFVPFLILVTFVFGGPYAAGFIFRSMGPWDGTAIEQDGSVTYMQFGAHLPRPEWVPVYPGAMVVGGSRLVSVKFPSGFHGLELATRASVDDVKQFYSERLTAAGFEVTDLGLLSLNPITAQMLGIAGAITAKRMPTDDRFDIQIRTAEGLVPSRLLQMHWRKISETPGDEAHRTERTHE